MEYNEFCYEEYAEIIKNVSTRWLCLEKCISREIQKYDGVQSSMDISNFPTSYYNPCRKDRWDVVYVVCDTTSSKSSLWVNNGKTCDFACRLPLKLSALNLFNSVVHFDDASGFSFSIATFYRPPATTISYDSNSSSPEKEYTSRNRLGTPPRRGVEKPEGPSALQPTTEYRLVASTVILKMWRCTTTTSLFHLVSLLFECHTSVKSIKS